jgi:hypothetical protein
MGAVVFGERVQRGRQRVGGYEGSGMITAQRPV